MTLRQASDLDAARGVVELIDRGIAPQGIWDALFAGAGEILLRRPGIIIPRRPATSGPWAVMRCDELRQVLTFRVIPHPWRHEPRHARNP